MVVAATSGFAGGQSLSGCPARLSGSDAPSRGYRGPKHSGDPVQAKLSPGSRMMALFMCLK